MTIANEVEPDRDALDPGAQAPQLGITNLTSGHRAGWRYPKSVRTADWRQILRGPHVAQARRNGWPKRSLEASP
jgi:hypothetical protein